MFSNLRTTKELHAIHMDCLNMSNEERKEYISKLPIIQGPNPAPLNVQRIKKHPDWSAVSDHEEARALVESLCTDTWFKPDINFLQYKYLNYSKREAQLDVAAVWQDSKLIKELDAVTDNRVTEVVNLAAKFRSQFERRIVQEQVHMVSIVPALFSKVAARDDAYNTHAIYSKEWYDCPLVFKMFLLESFQYVLWNDTKARDLPDIMILFNTLANLMQYSNSVFEWDFGDYAGMLKEYLEDNIDYGCYYSVLEARGYATITSEGLLPEDNDQHEEEFSEDTFCSLPNVLDVFRALPDSIFNSDQVFFTEADNDIVHVTY